jgi:hypothetical protein
MVAFTRGGKMQCAKYQHYFADDSWRVLSDLFRREVFSLHGLAPASSGSMLQRLVLSGVAALKTRCKCYWFLSSCWSSSIFNHWCVITIMHLLYAAPALTRQRPARRIATAPRARQLSSHSPAAFQRPLAHVRWSYVAFRDAQSSVPTICSRFRMAASIRKTRSINSPRALPVPVLIPHIARLWIHEPARHLDSTWRAAYTYCSCSIRHTRYIQSGDRRRIQKRRERCTK